MIEKSARKIIFSFFMLLAPVSLLLTFPLFATQGSLSNHGYGLPAIREFIFSGTGGRLSCQLYVTPDDATVKTTASRAGSIENAYKLAVGWAYVSDQRINGVTEEWMSPHDFLTKTPYYRNSPLPGKIAGDCEEQANTLASLIRALGVPAEGVRVVLGKASSVDDGKGHVWVELWDGRQWMALDPSSGPYWNDETERFVLRQGVPFDYFASHTYPLRVLAYYNDIYYLDAVSGSGNAPDWWAGMAGAGK